MKIKDKYELNNNLFHEYFCEITDFLNEHSNKTNKILGHFITKPDMKSGERISFIKVPHDYVGKIILDENNKIINIEITTRVISYDVDKIDELIKEKFIGEVIEGL